MLDDVDSVLYALIGDDVAYMAPAAPVSPVVPVNQRQQTAPPDPQAAAAPAGTTAASTDTMIANALEPSPALDPDAPLSESALAAEMAKMAGMTTADAPPTAAPAPQMVPPAATTPENMPAAARPAASDDPLAQMRRMAEGATLQARIEIQRGDAQLSSATDSQARNGADESNGRGRLQISVAQPPSVTEDMLTQGYQALISGQYNRALNLYAKVLEEQPQDVAALLGRASALHKLQQFDAAQAAYKKVLARDPQNTTALTNMLSILALQNPDDALIQLKNLEMTNGTFSPIPAQISTILAAKGQLSDAMVYMQRAVRLSPENTMYVYNLAVMQDQAGLAQDAAKGYQRVVAALRRPEGAGSPLYPHLASIEKRWSYVRKKGQ
jgi:tetratricopeptide (TPR) repeat protein